MINILDFMLLSKDSFNKLIDDFGIILMPTSDVYFITYLFANFMAYFFIYAFIKAVMTIYYMFFAKTDRKWLWYEFFINFFNNYCYFF